jgi:hypothetical protein
MVIRAAMGTGRGKCLYMSLLYKYIQFWQVQIFSTFFCIYYWLVSSMLFCCSHLWWDLVLLISKTKRMNIPYLNTKSNKYWFYLPWTEKKLKSYIIDNKLKLKKVDTKDYKITVCCFFTKHSALSSESRLVGSDTVLEWSNMSIIGCCFSELTIKIKLSMLV